MKQQMTVNRAKVDLGGGGGLTADEIKNDQMRKY